MWRVHSFKSNFYWASEWFIFDLLAFWLSMSLIIVKHAAILQPIDPETIWGVKTFVLLDEFNGVPQDTCFHKKKSRPNYFRPFKASLYQGRKKLVAFLFIQSTNLVDLRLLLQKFRKGSHTFGAHCISERCSRVNNIAINFASVCSEILICPHFNSGPYP